MKVVLLAKAQVQQPKGLRAGELAQSHRLQHLGEWVWYFGKHLKLALEVWVWVSWPREQESCPCLLLMAALGGLAKAVLENSL